MSHDGPKVWVTRTSGRPLSVSPEYSEGSFTVVDVKVPVTGWRPLQIVPFALKPVEVDGAPEGEKRDWDIVLTSFSRESGSTFRFSGKFFFQERVGRLQVDGRTASVEGTWDARTKTGSLQIFWPKPQGGKK